LEESRTTIYQRDHTVSYQLKMKTSRAVFSEVQKKAGPFPFNVRVLEDEKRARMGLQEAVQHSLVKPYEVMYDSLGTDKPETLYADEMQIHATEYLCRRIPFHDRITRWWTFVTDAPTGVVQTGAREDGEGTRGRRSQGTADEKA
jgi:hypothetical protein